MPTKLITTKNGKKTFLREIIVMDKTHPTLIVKIWDKELMEKSDQWTPKETSKQNEVVYYFISKINDKICIIYIYNHNKTLCGHLIVLGLTLT